MEELPDTRRLLECGLRDLADGPGLSPARLHRALENSARQSDGTSFLLDYVKSVSDLTDRQRSVALFRVIEATVNRSGSSDGDPHPDAGRHASALNAGFRLGIPELDDTVYDALNRRLDFARANDEFGRGASPEEATQYWAAGLAHLVPALADCLELLSADHDRWREFAAGADEFNGDSSDAQEVMIENLVATYTLKGRAVEGAVTERLIRATAAIDHYVVRASAPLGRRDRARIGGPAPRDRVNIRGLLNCRTGWVTRTPDGHGGTLYHAAMLLPDRLKVGQTCFFSSEVRGQRNEDPIVEIRVTSHGIAAGGLTLRVQFDKDFYPEAAWWFADSDGPERLICPPEGDERRLKWTTFGYLAHTFVDGCKPLTKYGLAWEWPTPPAR